MVFSQCAESLTERTDGGALQNDMYQATEYQLAGQGHNEAGNIKLGDPQTVPGTDGNADNQQNQFINWGSLFSLLFILKNAL